MQKCRRGTDWVSLVQTFQFLIGWGKKFDQWAFKTLCIRLSEFKWESNTANCIWGHSNTSVFISITSIICNHFHHPHIFWIHEYSMKCTGSMGLWMWPMSWSLQNPHSSTHPRCIGSRLNQSCERVFDLMVSSLPCKIPHVHICHYLLHLTSIVILPFLSQIKSPPTFSLSPTSSSSVFHFVPHQCQRRHSSHPPSPGPPIGELPSAVTQLWSEFAG